MLPHGSEQACIDGPLLAQACRTLVLWAPHGAYPNEAMPSFVHLCIVIEITIHVNTFFNLYHHAASARLFNLSAAYDAANAFGFTIGTTLHMPLI